MFKKQSSIFRNRPRELSAEEMKKIGWRGAVRAADGGEQSPVRYGLRDAYIQLIRVSFASRIFPVFDSRGSHFVKDAEHVQIREE